MMYAPIPQTMTDSDSEEEFRLQINTRPLKNSQIVTQNPRPANVHATLSRYNYDTDNRMMANTLPNVRFANSQSSYGLNDGDDHQLRFHHGRMPSDADNVAILNTNLKKLQPMSKSRKLCFGASIFVCVVTVILFVWVIPCSDEHSCPAQSERTQTHNWLRSYERVELKGAINVVHGLRGRSMNLVFMYRGECALMSGRYKQPSNPFTVPLCLFFRSSRKPFLFGRRRKWRGGGGGQAERHHLIGRHKRPSGMVRRAEQ